MNRKKRRKKNWFGAHTHEHKKKRKWFGKCKEMLRVISKQSANQARIELKWNCCESDETKEEKITKKKKLLEK